MVRGLIVGYLITVAIEAAVLWPGLARHHGGRTRLSATLLLTAATYPIVFWTLPAVMAGATRGAFLVVAETFAPVAEVLLFRLLTGPRATPRDAVAIVAANLLSFGLGGLIAERLW